MNELFTMPHALYDSPLHELRPGNAPALETRILDLTRARDAL